MIYFDKVSKIYNANSIALKDVTVTIEHKEFVSIVGHSGAGKTTLLKMILAEERPTKGVVYFDSQNIHKLRPKMMNTIRRKIGTIFQDFKLLPNKTAFENIHILKKIHDLGTTVILTTHNKGVVDSVGKRVITMEDGKITRDDKHGKYS